MRLVGSWGESEEIKKTKKQKKKGYHIFEREQLLKSKRGLSHPTTPPRGARERKREKKIWSKKCEK